MPVDELGQTSIPDHMKCDECGDVLLADEDWRLKPGLDPDEPTETADYIHARCHPGTEQEDR